MFIDSIQDMAIQLNSKSCTFKERKKCVDLHSMDKLSYYLAAYLLFYVMVNHDKLVTSLLCHVLSRYYSSKPPSLYTFKHYLPSFPLPCLPFGDAQWVLMPCAYTSTSSWIVISANILDSWIPSRLTHNVLSAMFCWPLLLISTMNEAIMEIWSSMWFDSLWTV